MGSIGTTTTAPKCVEATINYYREPDHGGEDTFIPGTAGFHRRKYNSKTVNVSYQLQTISLDTHTDHLSPLDRGYQRPRTRLHSADEWVRSSQAWS